jgi:hypothetical protein
VPILTDWFFGVSIAVAAGMIIEIIKSVVKEHQSRDEG